MLHYVSRHPDFSTLKRRPPLATGNVEAFYIFTNIIIPGFLYDSDIEYFKKNPKMILAMKFAEASSLRAFRPF